eukprot:CAMPEP_0114609066 /NCGR_PEP_ID=MMETSP0168-20121206/2899_1 /TAXON_ID=95228 ORGANISM="Vannella sp., Strain DIVA3 517/6/12" /NCGR_SAMPLE_ID=MMETSP0168 /ASSEMBLY_ACC=CAM_ASM_000044 /LENGTH=124 /DNA_ID=CAMNT_0001819977 /DNA_START=72 /DNA_END=446 /DNA_ORIENTATION=+
MTVVYPSKPSSRVVSLAPTSQSASATNEPISPLQHSPNPKQQNTAPQSDAVQTSRHAIAPVPQPSRTKRKKELRKRPFCATCGKGYSRSRLQKHLKNNPSHIKSKKRMDGEELLARVTVFGARP